MSNSNLPYVAMVCCIDTLGTEPAIQIISGRKRTGLEPNLCYFLEDIIRSMDVHGKMSGKTPPRIDYSKLQVKYLDY